MANVQKIIDQAKKEASQRVADDAATPGAVAVAPAAYDAVPAVARKKTLDDLGAGGMDVDTYLKVSEHGLTIGGEGDLVEEVVVAIDVSRIQVFEGIRYGGKNPIYDKTYDGYKSVKGGLWSAALARAQQVDPMVRTYEGADIEMTLLEDAMDIKGKKVVAEAGTRLGHSTSVTNKANLRAFIDQVKAENLEQSVVKAKITAERRSNKDGNVWGVLSFELIGEHNPDA